MTKTQAATAVAHPIQGLIKYHGLKDPSLRIPYHDSISVCAEAMFTRTTVEFSGGLQEHLVTVNGRAARGEDLNRVAAVLKALTRLHGGREAAHARVTSENSVTSGKGLGFSASGFAALGLAACKALGMALDDVLLSEAVRLGAGSATRSLVGGFAVWYADKGGRSYAESLVAPGNLDLGMVIVPIGSSARTDEAHRDVVTSPLFESRLRYVGGMLEEMKKAIADGDVDAIGRLAEEDTLNLHATTMTCRSHMILWEPDTLRVIRKVEALRRGGLPCWYSLDTGPSVFINSHKRDMNTIVREVDRLGLLTVASGVGPPAHLV
jgi:phosphomevalonate decarboxylase